MKRIIFCVLLIVGHCRSFAQVNIQTGSATFSLPMFNWQDDKSRLSLAVGLSYNSGNGLKTNDVASNVGQGWNLLAGGSITRLQVGEPDDQFLRNGPYDDQNKYPAGYLYSSVSASTGCPNALTKYPIFKNTNQIYRNNTSVTEDRELDYFAFQFNGRTGMFVLDKANNRGITLGDSRLQIAFTTKPQNDMTYGNRRMRTSINSFTIRDENGLLYTFEEHSISESLKRSFTDPLLKGELHQPNFENDNVYRETDFEDPSKEDPLVINGWYLSKIEDQLAGRSISFNYTTRTIKTNAGVDIAYHEGKNYAILTHSISKSFTPAITSITLPDGHSVAFGYGDERVDMPGDHILSSVGISYKARSISSYLLKSTYFILNRYGNPQNDYQRRVARLALHSVVQFGVDAKGFNEPYVFDYYTGSDSPDDIVPPPFSPIKDIWGFYNGDLSLGAAGGGLIIPRVDLSGMNIDEAKGLCFLRNSTGGSIVINPKTGYAKNGLLKTIAFPTGSILRYKYDQNYGVLANQYREVGGVHVSSTELADGGYSNDCDHPLVTNYGYAQEGSTQSSLWGVEAPNNHITGVTFYEPASKYWTWKGGLFGTCRYRYQYPGILSREQAINLKSSEQLMMAVSEVLSAVSTVLAALDVVLYVSGVGAPLAVALDIIFGLYALISTCTRNMSDTVNDNIYYSSNLNALNPLPTQFSRVVVTPGGGSSGKTIYTFTNPNTGTNPHAIWEPNNFIFSMKQRYSPWAYGLPEKITVKDAADQVVKETVNVYSYAHARQEILVSSTPLKSCKCFVTKSESQRSDNWQSPSLAPYATGINWSSNLQAELYSVFTGRVELTDTYERDYSGSNQTKYTEKKTHYDYNSINLQVNHIETIQSDGLKNHVDITFSSDYNTGILNTLKSANVLNLPVRKINSISRPDDEYQSRYILQETVTEYYRVGGTTGDVKPKRTLIHRTDHPVLNTLWDTYLGPTVTPSSNFKEVQTLSHDAEGNLKGIKDEGDRHITNIYDYDDKYNVAVIVNAEYGKDTVAYSSFETTSLGGWKLDGNTSYNSTSSVTGKRSLNLDGSTTLWKVVNSVSAYKLSFWASTSNISVNSGTLVKSAPTIGGFTYYEYEFSNLEVLYVYGTGVIDEVRLYPATSRIKTVTYDPLIGKTCECDENSRLTYYEYDDMARVRFIRDDKKNIVKMYEYNIKKNPCKPLYLNKRISEYFTNSNCGADQTSDPVEYVVPAGSYSSYNSQLDADLQAQHQLNTMGQAHANSTAECQILYSNDGVSVDFYPNNCPLGYTSLPVTYTIPAGKYKSKDQKVPKQLEDGELLANGQAYANAHGVCNEIDYSPTWETEGEEADTKCENKHKWVKMKDINPNSPTFNTWEWIDVGETEDCK
jgi:hypothetical protein